MINNVIQYKMRVPNTVREMLHTYAGSYDTTPAEIIRMALRRWRTKGGVDVSEFHEAATREASMPYTVAVPAALVKGYDASTEKEANISGKLVVAIVRWYLSQYPSVPQTAKFSTPLREGVDYIYEEA